MLLSATLDFWTTCQTDSWGRQPGRRDLLPLSQLSDGRVERGEPLPSVVPHVTFSSMTSHQPLPALPMEAAHSNVHTQRLGSAEWPKWQQSSWPRRLRPAEWSSLCPHGHRGLAELGCFLRGHLAGLCSYPSNAGTGISTWFRGYGLKKNGL